MPWPLFTPPGKTRYPLYRRLAGPQGRSGQVRKISPPTGFDPRTFQPVASRYTDYANRPTQVTEGPHNSLRAQLRAALAYAYFEREVGGRVIKALEGRYLKTVNYIEIWLNETVARYTKTKSIQQKERLFYCVMSYE
jgi:hypothetical protein